MKIKNTKTNARVEKKDKNLSREERRIEDELIIFHVQPLHYTRHQ
ncbi:MAG: hypothetical protein QHH14_02445 [Clostridiales bacterium]|jgi:hypothetical protein|nr:hypothetical protein [Clostridiales bacterium]